MVNRNRGSSPRPTRPPGPPQHMADVVWLIQSGIKINLHVGGFWFCSAGLSFWSLNYTKCCKLCFLSVYVFVYVYI